MTQEYQQYAGQLKNQKLFELEDLYQARLETYIPALQEHFCDTCETILHLQQQKKLGKLSYLEYTLLLTNIIRHQMSAEIRVYDDRWYFDAGQLAVASLDCSFFLRKYQELWDELMSARKRFQKTGPAQETTAFLLSCASQFYKYIVSALRFSILPCTEKEPFVSIQRAEEFEINAGEYMAHTEAVYKENHKRTSREALEWFAMREEYDYAFESFTGLDFSGADLSEIDLRYADLRKTSLDNTDFQDSMLFGTRFCHASMQHTDLRYCLLHESDFTGADLTNARFTAAKAYRGVPDSDRWSITGYRSVSFRNANLTHADFTRTNIKDADFTGAIMDGTRIDRGQLHQFALSPAQLQAIRLV